MAHQISSPCGNPREGFSVLRRHLLPTCAQAPKGSSPLIACPAPAVKGRQGCVPPADALTPQPPGKKARPARLEDGTRTVPKTLKDGQNMTPEGKPGRTSSHFQICSAISPVRPRPGSSSMLFPMSIRNFASAFMGFSVHGKVLEFQRGIPQPRLLKQLKEQPVHHHL